MNTQQKLNLTSLIALGAGLSCLIPLLRSYFLSINRLEWPYFGIQTFIGISFVSIFVARMNMVLIVIWVTLLFVFGFISSKIPFFISNNFYGEGFPFPALIWDHGKDFVAPLAIVGNVVVFVAFGFAITLGFHWLFCRIKCKAMGGFT